MFDGYAIEDSFEDLLNVFSYETVSAFSACFFPIGHSALYPSDSFEKYIYTKGNSQEIYIIKERLLIERIQQFYICSEFYLLEKHHRFPCRLIAIDLRTSTTLLYDALATMKICHKALDGFNVYLLVGSNAIHIGCDVIGDISKTACTLSYPITKSINWDSLLYTFLEIADDKGFFNYYHSLIDTISSIYLCYSEKYDSYETFHRDDVDTDYVDEWYDIADESLYLGNSKSKDENDNDLINHLRCFLAEVEDVEFDLSFIVTNRVNPLEMLFDAERQAERTVEESVVSGLVEETDKDSNEELYSLLTDPEKLIKALINKNNE